MKIFKLLLAAILAAGSIAVHAEPRIFVRSNGQFVADGSEYRRGFWIPVVEDAEKVFAENAEAAKAYESHKALGKWFGILNWGAVGASVVYAIAAGDDYNGGTGLAIFLVPWVTGLFVGAQSQKHLIRAINIVNGVPVNLANKDIQPPTRYSLTPTVAAPILAWSF